MMSLPDAVCAVQELFAGSELLQETPRLERS
jgi:hypothetical protein